MVVSDKPVHTSTRPGLSKPLPAIPAKRYFTIGEVSDLCQVKPYVLRYWEQEFTQLKPMKRRGNRRYYQHHEVLLIRRIRDLLYDQGFTISGARNRLADAASIDDVDDNIGASRSQRSDDTEVDVRDDMASVPSTSKASMSRDQLRVELLAIRRLLIS